MSKVLSQEEVDALLSSAAALQVGPGAVGTEASGDVRAYNFRRPDRVSKEQIRSLHFLHDRFARNVATSLSAYLRAVTAVNIASVEQFTYSEFLMSLPDPTAFYALSMPPLDGMAALELNPNVAFSMIDRMLGGSGRGTTLTRALTEIEQNVIDAVVKLIAENLTETWRGVVDVQFSLSGRETRPQMLQVAEANEVVVLLAFDIRLGDARGLLNVCIPASIIEAIGARFRYSWQRSHREPTPIDRRHLVNNLGRVALPVSTSLDTTVKARDLLQLKPGDVVTLGLPVRRPLDIRVRGALKFRGWLAAQGDQASVRIEQVAAGATPEA